MIEAFLFDLDGVLVDTAVYHFEAWKKMANLLGFDFDEEFNETLKGISRMDSLNAILKQGGKELTEAEKVKYAAMKNEWYLELVNTMTKDNILPGVETFIKEAKALNIKIALGSASKNSAIILEKTELAKYFDAIIDGNHVKKSKPDPEVFINGALALGVKNEVCLVFEDAYAGVQAAKSANMMAIGIGDAAVLDNADLVFKNLVGVNPEELIQRLKKLI